MKALVLITGATGGVGKAFCAECASRGWDLLLTDQPGSALEEIATGLRRLYTVEVDTLSCNLSAPASRAAFWAEVARRDLHFWMLINIAGMEFEGGFAGRTLQELRTITRLNVETVTEMTHSVLQHRDPAQTLRVINISSLAGFFPMPYKAVYAASKGFIINFSLALNRELRDDNATVTVVCPAALPTSQRSIRGLANQGWLGQLSLSSANQVAAASLNAALAGHPQFIPGLFNRMVHLLTRLLPPRLITRWIARRWRTGVD